MLERELRQLFTELCVNRLRAPNKCKDWSDLPRGRAPSNLTFVRHSYDQALAAGDALLQVLLNLALLYWQATDLGMAAAKKLSPEFLATAGRRFPELLEEARRRFPESTEARFWKRYIAWADLGEPLGDDECRRLLQEDPASLAPAMHLFATSQGKEAQAEAHALLRRCRDDGTTGARYVASVIEGVIKHASHHR